MDSTQRDATTGDQAIRDAIGEFLQRGSKSGNYKANLRAVLTNFHTDWDRADEINRLSDVDTEIMADYATHLYNRFEAHQSTSSSSRGHTDKEPLAQSSVWTYYDMVSAFFDYCVKWEKIATNPAKSERVKDQLPDRPTPDSGSQQFWSASDRRALLDYVDRRASEAIDEKGSAAVVEIRDKALAYVLAYTGVRGAEILRDPRDTRRNGISWSAVEIDDNRMTILGKNQKIEPAQLPKQTHGPLNQLRHVVDPPTDEWPVFVSHHAPSMYDALPDDFERPDDDEQTLLDHCRTHGVRPPALSTSGARNLMQRLCEAAEIDIDGEYLKPHGGRRGAGDKLYRDQGSEDAQGLLRHANPKTTSQMYSHVDASEAAENTTDAFSDER